MMKRGYFNSAFKRRYFRLYPDDRKLLYYEYDRPGTRQRGYVDLDGATVLLQPEDFNLCGFKVMNNKNSRVFNLQTTDKVALSDWVKALGKVKSLKIKDFTLPPPPSGPAPGPPQRKVSSIDAPDEFVCPITCELMCDPVSLDGKGKFNFDRLAIEKWFEKGNSLNPLTGEMLHFKEGKELRPNIELKTKIERWIAERREKEVRQWIREQLRRKQADGKSRMTQMKIKGKIKVKDVQKSTLSADWNINGIEATTYDKIAICAEESGSIVMKSVEYNSHAKNDHSILMKHQLPAGKKYVLRYIDTKSQVLAQSDVFEIPS